MKQLRLFKFMFVLIACVPLFLQNSVLAGSQLSFKWDRKPAAQAFSDTYSEVEGVLTFRGSGDRSSPSFGTVNMKEFRPKMVWTVKTGKSSWGGGAGWTGQPALVRWSPEVLQTMNVKAKFRTKPGFTEVIYASLDGKVYFMDLETGEATRNPITVGNPIKGSVSVDARGYPLLYVGEGIPEKGGIGFNLYSLTDQKRLFHLEGSDSFATRRWGAFDGSALFNRKDDTLLVGGENGVFYNLKLNTRFVPAKKSLSVKPVISKYKYAIAGNPHQGIENSVAVYDNLAFFADNGGSLQAMNLRTKSPEWSLASTDDTDATIVVEQENGAPYLYTGTEVDKQGTHGMSTLRKIDGMTGRTVWQKKYACFSLLGEHPVNGGLLATPVMGKHQIADLVIFTLARYGTFDSGLMVALDKKTGQERWRLPMKHYAWSSPVDVYAENGTGYLVQADSRGTIMIIDARTGRVKGSLNTGGNIEATPAVLGNLLVVASRNGNIYGLRLL
jgi:outer membrane protein assembly factor BamB